jgi:hypothetical protein
MTEPTDQRARRGTLEDWLRFIRSESQIMRQYPRLLFQEAANQPVITPLLDMVTRVEDFNLPELLDWTQLFIRDHFGDPEPELVKGEYEDFGGTNSHASEIGGINEAFAAGVPEEDVINYRPGDSDDPRV